MVNLGELERAVGLSIGYTLYSVPLRSASPSEVEADKRGTVDNDGAQEAARGRAGADRNKKDAGDEILERARCKHVDEGFGRLDALNRIGNQVFFANLCRQGHQEGASKDLQKVDAGSSPGRNFARHDAPVSFPPIWSTPWFSWAQYDASVHNELVRNAGEALGVNAKVNLREYGNSATAAVPLIGGDAEHLLVRAIARGRRIRLTARRGSKACVAPKWADAAGCSRRPGLEARRDLVDRGPRALPQALRRMSSSARSATRTTSRPSGTTTDWVNMGGQRVFQRRAHAGRCHWHRSPTGPRADRAAGQSAGSARPASDRASQCARLVRACPVRSRRRPGTRLECAVRAGADGGGRPHHRAVVRGPSGAPPPSRKSMRGPRPNCQNRRVFRTVAGIPKRRGPSFSRFRTTARARSMASGRRRPICTTARCRPCRTCCTPQHKRPKIFCVGSRQFDPVKVGLAQPEGGACGAYTRFDTDASRQQQPRPFVRRHRSRPEEAAERCHRPGTDGTRTQRAGRIPQDALRAQSSNAGAPGPGGTPAAAN